MNWLLVAIIVASTTGKDILQAVAMKSHGEIQDFRPGALGKVLRLLAKNRIIIASIVCSAISFFAFLRLVSTADLSFAVPATAASYVFETILANLLAADSTDWLDAEGYEVAAGCGLDS